MNVTIEERKFSFTSKYDIDTPGENWFARKAVFAWPARIQLQHSDGQPIATLQGQFSFFRSRFQFSFSGGRQVLFQCEKRWKGVYVCADAKESWCLYRHHGLRYSIFQGDRQIAAFEKNRVVIGSGNRFSIRMNHDADVAVIVSMVLALNTSEGDDDNQASVSVDLGSIGPEAKHYDESWEPN